MATKRNVPHSSKKHKVTRQKKSGVAPAKLSNEQSRGVPVVTLNNMETSDKVEHVPVITKPTAKHRPVKQRRTLEQKARTRQNATKAVVFVIAFIMIASLVVVPGL